MTIKRAHFCNAVQTISLLLFAITSNVKAETNSFNSEQSQINETTPYYSKYFIHNKPKEKVKHFLYMLENAKGLSKNERFKSFEQLTELYLKTEQLNKAQATFKSLEAEFNDSAIYQAKLALIKSHLLLSQHTINEIPALLEPHLKNYTGLSNPELEACYLLQIGSYQVRKHQFSEAFKNLTKAYGLSERNQLTHLKIGIKHQLVQLYYYSEQFDKAIKQSDDILRIARKNGDRFSEVKALANKMNLYYVKAETFAIERPKEDVLNNPEYQKLVRLSNHFQNEAYRLSKSIQAFKTMSKTLILKQSLLFIRNHFRQAIKVGQQVLELGKQHGYDYEVAVASNNIAIAHRELGQFEQSLKALKTAEHFYSKIENQQSLIWVYDDYARTYELSGRPNKALKYYKKHHELSIEFVSKTNNQTLLDLQEKYEANQREVEIERLTHKAKLDEQKIESERMGRWLLTVIITALVLIALILWQKRKSLKASLNKESALNKKITDANIAKQRFFNNLSHEFRTALTLSIGPLKNLQRKPDYQSNQLGESALENNLHMLTLINEVLEIERIDSNTLPMRVSKVNLEKAIEACIGRFKLQFKEKELSLNIKGFDSTIYVYFDTSHLEKIISNVLSNAGKYCGPYCVIDICAQRSGDAIQLIICDNGPGIDKEEMPYIFNRFYQGKNSVDKKLPGTGIGLSMVKELMELHQGSVELVDKKEKGCCIKMRFRSGSSHYPEEILIQNTSNEECQEEICIQGLNFAQLPEQQHQAKEAEGLQSGKLHQKQTILVVDDNSNIRNLIRSILQPEYHIAEAENGDSALKLASAIQPDLVITDVMMPLMNGFQLTEKLRKNKHLSHLSILLLTALTETEQHVTGLEIGADDYLTKPFDNDELKARVRSHLKRKEKYAKTLLERYQSSFDEFSIANEFEGQERKRAIRLNEIIKDNISQYDFDVEQMYQSLNMTRSSLYRFTQKLFQCSPMILLKRRRLELAYKILQENSSSVSEVAYAVGYQSLSAFSRSFREHFNIPPTKVKRKATENTV